MREKSKSLGHEGVPSEGRSRSHQVEGTPIARTPNFSLPPTDVEYEEGASPTSPGEKPGRPLFQCTHCPEREPYAQKQGLMRHYQEKHESALECSHPDCDYKWSRSRRSEYRKHLTRKHRLEGDEIDGMLGRPRRRRGRVIESSPPSIERDRQSLAKPQQRPQMVPLLAVGKDTNHTSPAVVSSVAHNPSFGQAEPDITTTEHEDSSGLEHLAATHAPSRLLSENEFARLMEHMKIHGRIRFVHAFFKATCLTDSAVRFPSVHPGASTTDNIQPNPGMLHIPALASPVRGYHAHPVL